MDLTERFIETLESTHGRPFVVLFIPCGHRHAAAAVHASLSFGLPHARRRVRQVGRIAAIVVESADTTLLVGGQMRDAEILEVMTRAAASGHDVFTCGFGVDAQRQLAAIKRGFEFAHAGRTPDRRAEADSSG